MRKLTQKDDQGNWCLRGVPWVNLRAGQVITDKTAELLYRALWKLMEYEAIDLAPEEVERMKDVCEDSAGVLVNITVESNIDAVMGKAERLQILLKEAKLIANELADSDALKFEIGGNLYGTEL